jgi:hypothetical protein
VVRDNRIKQKVHDVTPADGQSYDLCNGIVALDNVEKRHLPFLMYCFHLYFENLGFLVCLVCRFVIMCWVMSRMGWDVPAVNIYIYIYI